MAALVCLSSCDDKDKAETPAAQPAAQPAEQPAAQPAEDLPTAAETRRALFEQAVYGMAAKVTAADRYPELNRDVKNFLEMLGNYYEALCRENGDVQERARLSLLIAQTTRDLGAYPKAQAAFERALADIEALSPEAKATAEFKHSLSAVYNGMGSCLLAQNKGQEALGWYEKAVQLDEERILALAPAEGEEIEGDVPAELSQAAADAMDSYRCMGDCLHLTGDTEEAFETCKKGVELCQRLKRLSPDMSVSYIKLLTAVGNLYNATGKIKEAFVTWRNAAQLCETVNASQHRAKVNDLPYRPDVMADTKRCHGSLMFALKAAAVKLNEEAGEETPAPAEQGDEGIQTEPIAPLPEATATAPVEPAADAAPEPAVAAAAPEPASAPAAAPAPAKAQPQNNKRHKRR